MLTHTPWTQSLPPIPQEMTPPPVRSSEPAPPRSTYTMLLLPEPRPQTEHQQHAYKATELPDPMNPSVHKRQPPWPLFIHTTIRPPRCGSTDPPAKAPLLAPWHPCTTTKDPNCTSCPLDPLEPHCRASTAHYSNTLRMLPTPPSRDQAGPVLDPPCPSPYCLSALCLSQQSADKASLPFTILNFPPQTLTHPTPPPTLHHHDPPRSDTSMHHSPANHSPTHPKLQRSKIHTKPALNTPSWPSPDSSPQGYSSTSQSVHHNPTTTVISDTNTALLKSATFHKLPATNKLPQPHTNTNTSIYTQNGTPNHTCKSRRTTPKAAASKKLPLHGGHVLPHSKTAAPQVLAWFTYQRIAAP